MARNRFQKLNFKDYGLSRVQDKVEKAFSSVDREVILGGNLITGLTAVSSTTTSIDHQLGKVPRYWNVVPKASATFYEVSRNSTNLVLQFSANCPFDIYIS